MARAVHAHQRSRATSAIARRELALESALAKLDKYHLLILDDIVYVPQQRQRVTGGYRAKKAQVTGAIPRCDTATEWTWA